MTIERGNCRSSGSARVSVTAGAEIGVIIAAFVPIDRKPSGCKSSEFAVRFPSNGTGPLVPILVLGTWHEAARLGGAVSSHRSALRRHPVGPVPRRPRDF